MGLWEVALRNEPLSTLKPRIHRGRGRKGHRTTPSQRRARAEHEREQVSKIGSALKRGSQSAASGVKELRRLAKEGGEQQSQKAMMEKKLKKIMKTPSKFKGKAH